MPDCYDIAILGAGAAGLMAGISAGRAQGDLRIVALDGATKLGAKILVSGGGRCNVTHHAVTPADYAGPTRGQINKILKSFPVDQTVAFFEELGVALKREDTGKLFPVTNKAHTVLNALLDAARDAGVELKPGHRVESVQARGGHFTIETNTGTLSARRVILATGGKSLPKTGSDGHGYTLVRSLGHTVTATTPALVPLILPDGHWLTGHSGTALDVELNLTAASGKVLARQAGAMLATHFGLSGPAPMDISRHWLAARAQASGVRLRANLLPGRSFDDVEADLINLAGHGPTDRIGHVLSDHLPHKLARDVVGRAAGVDPATPLGQLKRDDRREVVHALTALELPVVRDRGYTFAEVTAGGVPLGEVALATMASRRCPGLSLCGEILDCDGRIGGFNFQWAWCTGRLAGRGAADSLRSDPA